MGNHGDFRPDIEHIPVYLHTDRRFAHYGGSCHLSGGHRGFAPGQVKNLPEGYGVVFWNGNLQHSSFYCVLFPDDLLVLFICGGDFALHCADYSDADVPGFVPGKNDQA